MPFILGTAGHIDHGKTTLVKALTGINCDRLEEEQRRGITIELGFAWLDLPGGEKLGIVDVPGHERFIKKMVAGASGIDMAMLVIAADEGVMPQTREHLEVCSLLGIRHGLVALTKIDMVDQDWLEMVQEDVRGALQGSFLESASIYPVSATTGQGVAELKAALLAMTKELPKEQRPDVFRLPIDRVFSMKGFGTVVTGTVISGSITTDSDAVLMPSGKQTHIRSLQRHEHEIEKAISGERCAANLQGLEVQDIERGEIVSVPGVLEPALKWLVEVEVLPTSPIAIKNKTEVHLHHGTLETQARVHLFGLTQLEPGHKALAEIRFTQPMVAVFGDHCLIRAASPLRVIAGGPVVYPLDLELRSKDPALQQKLEALRVMASLQQSATLEADTLFIAKVLLLRAEQGASYAQLLVLTGFSKKRLDKALQELSRQQKVLCFDKEERSWIEANAFQVLGEQCLERLRALHQKFPLQPGFARAALEADWSKGLPKKLLHKVIETLLKEQKLVLSGETIKLAGYDVVLDDKQEALSQSLLQRYEQADLNPPNVDVFVTELKVTRKELEPIVKFLVKSKQLIKITEDMYYSAASFARILATVSEWSRTHEDLSIADMKTLFGLSRKYIIALLEYMDREKITVRIGDKRQFRSLS